MTIRKWFIALFAAVNCLTAAACGQSNRLYIPEAVTPAPVYALVVKDVTNPYMQRMYEGFKAACDETNAVALLEGPKSTSIEEQIEAIERLVESDEAVEAIAVAANDVDALETVLTSAMDKGIQVISLDSAVNPKSRALHIQQANPEIIGRVLIEAAAKMIEGSGEIALLSATEQATNQNLWIRWMKQELVDYPEKYENVRIVDIVYGDDNLETSCLRARELLESYPELDIIIAPTVVGMVAAGQVIRESRSDVLLTGLGLPSEMEPFIKKGICPWMYLWNPIDIGYLAGYTVAALNGGEISGQAGENFSAGKLGVKQITEGYDGGLEVMFANPFKFDINNIAEWKSIY